MKTRVYTKYGRHLIVELEKCIKYAEVKMVCMKIWQKALLENIVCVISSWVRKIGMTVSHLQHVIADVTFLNV